MASRWIPRALGALVTVAFAAAVWWLLAPPQIGGATGYVVTRGNSMEPLLSQGDLVVTRARSSYGVGDVVLYRSEALGGEHVLHRIVDLENGRFVTRGDNNPANDPDRFTQAEIVGGLWLTAPGAGSWLNWLGQPLQLAVLIFLLVFLVLAGGREASRRRGLPDAPPVRAEPAGSGSWTARLVPATSGLLVAGLAACLLFGALGLVSWTRPTTQLEEVPGGYVHVGRLSYAATVPRSPVYPDGTVETGQAVFATLVERVTFAFDYRFNSVARAEIRGGIGLDAVVSDGKGWSRPLTLAPTRPFSGQRAHVEGTLGLARLETAVARMRTLTNSGENRFEVRVTPRVQAAGYAGTTVIDTTFDPALVFTYDGSALRLDASQADAETLLSPREEGPTTRLVHTTVGAGPLALPVDDARAFAGLGLVAGLLLAGSAAIGLALGRRGPSVGVLHRHYGARIVRAQIVIPDGRWITDVDDPESLGTIAEHYDRVILHGAEAGADVYVVDDGVAVYRFTAADRRVASAGRISPAQST